MSMLRHWCRVLVAALVLALPTISQADDAAARAIVEKGLKALGGADNVAKFKAATFKLKGTFHGMGAALPYVGTWSVQQPDKMRFVIEFEVNNMKITFTRVFDGANGWMKIMDMTMELSAEQVAEAKREAYANQVLMLLPLVKDKEFTLAALGDAEVEKRPAVGVKVSRKGQRDINLYFDKETGLPIKSERQVREEESGRDVAQEEVYSDYKEIDGVKHAMKMVIKREGKLFVDGEVTEFKAETKLDDSVFGKP
jgi:outer membrane lipoprotein-sorting protein